MPNCKICIKHPLRRTLVLSQLYAAYAFYITLFFKNYMNTKQQTEYWLSGPVENIPSLLQPVAHALLQSRDELECALQHFNENLLWVKPADIASVGFHLLHLTGVLDRLFTYAKAEQLNNEQLHHLAEETKEHPEFSLSLLINNYNLQVEKSLQQLSKTNQATLTEERLVGRKKIPSTVNGLLFHAAEHTMRHIGQMIVTIKFVTEKSNA